MSEEKLALSRDEGSAKIITLNRPDKRNAMNFELLRDLGDALEEAATDPKVRTLIFNGEGPGFSAGIDFFALGAVDMSGAGPFRRIVRQMQGAMNQLAFLEKPIICMMHGFCVGMALELALACDFRIAEAGCKINIEEVRLGLIPDVGGSTRLVRAIGLPRAKEMIMTGKSIDAETAAQWGLVNEVAPAGKGLETALRWHEDLCQGSPMAVGLSKIVLDRAYDLDSASSMALEGIAQSSLITSEDVKEGVASRIEKRAPKWKGR